MKVKTSKPAILANDPDFGPQGADTEPIDEPTGDTLDKLRQVVAKFAADMHAEVHTGSRSLELSDLSMVDKAAGILIQIQESERKAAKDVGVTHYTIEQALELLADKLTVAEFATLKAKVDQTQPYPDHTDTDLNPSPVSYASKETLPEPI